MAQQSDADAPIEIVWEAPPIAGRPSMYDKVLAELKSKPGQWARIRSDLPTSSGAYSARKSFRTRAGDDPRWEVTVSQLPGSDQWGLWARYRTPDQVREAK